MNAASIKSLKVGSVVRVTYASGTVREQRLFRVSRLFRGRHGIERMITWDPTGHGGHDGVMVNAAETRVEVISF